MLSAFFEKSPRGTCARLGAGLALLGLAVLIDRKPGESIQVGNLRNPLAGSNNPLDHLAYKEPNVTAGNRADFGLYGGPTLPLLFSFYPESDTDGGQDYPEILTVWLEAMVLNFAITSLIKNTTSRPRPYVLHEDFSPNIFLTRNDRAAFLSGHASNAAVGSTLFALLVTHYFNRPATSLFAWAIAGLLQTSTAYLRVKAAKHWPTDAVAGLILGQVVARGIFIIHFQKRGAVQIAIGSAE